MFGPHLIIDGSKCDTAKLADRLLVERLLAEYPRAIGMTRIGGPYMFEYQAPDPAYSGVSGLVVIAESHIAIHTFPALDFFTMDIFSCKNFDHEVAIDYIRQALGVREMDRMLVQRGLSFRGPHHGPLGATDELMAAAAARNAGLEGTTIGSIPLDDPLYPKPQQGHMLWPTYGQMPDMGTYMPDSQADATICSGGPRGGAIVIPANAAAAGTLAQPGLTPTQPMALNPTASTSGIIDRMASLGGQGRQLGRALAQWEMLARTPDTQIILALGPRTVADGLRDIVADLIQRHHVAAIVLEDDALLDDAYESLGYRHYVAIDGDDQPRHTDEEWHAATTQLAALMRTLDIPGGKPITSQAITEHLGLALAAKAPRPGILSTAARCAIPVIAVGSLRLASIGVSEPEAIADVALLQRMQAAAPLGIVAFGIGASAGTLLADAVPTAHAIAIASVPLHGPCIVSRIDASVALPLLATGLVQRLPYRPAVSTAIPLATSHDREQDTLLPIS